jgi:hypothetical protein
MWASKKASKRSDGFRLPSFCRAVIRWSIFVMSGKGRGSGALQLSQSPGPLASKEGRLM